MKKAVIFDMDGVLLDSQPLYHKFDFGLLSGLGHTVTNETVILYSGLTSVDRMTKYKNDFKLNQPLDELVKLSVDTMRDIFISGELQPIKGIPELLRELQNLGVPLGVASSTSPELINLILKKLDVLHFFDKIVSGEGVKKGKPAPDVYLKAAGAIGFLPEECIAIEDSVVGMLSAKSAGLTCIAYRNSYTYDYSNADYTVDDFLECMPLIKKLCAGEKC